MSDTLSQELEDAGIIAETVVSGKTAPRQEPQKACTHDRSVMTENFVAFIKDDDGVTIEWQMRVRAECVDCNTKFVIAPTGRVPRDGGPGVVVSMLPEDQAPEPDLSAFTPETSREDPPCA